MKTICLAALGLLVATLHASARAESPNDYAYAAPIAATAATPFQRIALPTSAYGVLTHGDLRDVRVFNGAGEVVPHAFEPRPTTQFDDAAPIDAALFALPKAASAAAGGVAVQVERRGDGTVVSVRESPGNGPAAPDAYLVDASQLKRTLRALMLTPADANTSFAGRLRVEASDDLEHWRLLVAGAPLLVARSGDRVLSRLRIEWPATEAKYLRLAWADAAAHAVIFTGVKLEPAQRAREPARVWQGVEPLRIRLDAGEFAYELPVGAPIDRLRIQLPQKNSVVAVKLLTRDAAERDWRAIGSHIVYRLEQNGAEFDSPEIALGASRQLLLRYDTAAGALGNGAPAVEVGWIPHTLVFAARGNGPFILAYGNARAAATAYPIASLVPGYDDEKSRELIGEARLGEAAAAGGRERLAPQADYRRWILWGVLIAGVLALGAMAYRLWSRLGLPADNAAGGQDRNGSGAN